MGEQPGLTKAKQAADHELILPFGRLAWAAIGPNLTTRLVDRHHLRQALPHGSRVWTVRRLRAEDRQREPAAPEDQARTSRC